MLTVDLDRREVVVAPPAEIDIATVDQLSRDIAGACAMSPVRVVVDFSRVRFCDTTGLDVLLRALERMHDQGCALEIRRPNRCLRRIASLSGTSAALGLPPLA